MSLSIRHWLAERHIELVQLGDSSAQIAGIAFRIAQDMEVKSLNPFSISGLTDVLELPLKAARYAAPAISQLTVGLIRILSRKKPLRRNEGTWLTFQVAYLNALQGILEQEYIVGRPWVNRADVPGGLDTDQSLSDPQLLGLLKTLRPGRLSDSQAEQALSLVAESFLVQQMNNLARVWFVANGAEETEARLLTQRLSNGLPGYLMEVIAENPLPLAQLQKFVRLGNLGSLRATATTNNPDVPSDQPTDTLPLNLHREHYRAELLQSLAAPELGEPFSLKDLYIPLKGKILSNETRDWGMGTGIRTYLSQSPVDLMEWAMSQLEDKTTIAVIEAEPGSGKTSFCQIWAARVAQELYPTWMPVHIRLKDATLGQSLEQTLESAFPIARFTDTDGWFSLNSPPCLLILDGLDELPLSKGDSRHLWSFMEQVMRFGTQYRSSALVGRHKIIITSRRATLEDLIRKYQQRRILDLPSQIRAIAIEPMGQEEFRQWFSGWAKLQSKEIAQAYFNFLRHGGVFKQSTPMAQDLAALLRRPFILYLIGILHRDAWVDESIFQVRAPQVKFEIYDRVCRWLLGEPAAESGPIPTLIREGFAHASRSPDAIANLLEGSQPQDLRNKMQVVALKVIQMGQYHVSQTLIERSLSQEAHPDVLPATLPALFFRSQPLKLLGNKGIGSEQRRKIEFSHLSLGEYLAAQEIATQLQAITEQVQDQYGEVTFFLDSSVNVAQYLYALLGYGLLSAEVEELAIECLRRLQKRNSNAFSFSLLFKRLYRFYKAYCRGRWLDEGIVGQAHSQLQALQNPLNVLQIDAAVGLNVFLLLCSTAREAQIPFWPCGNPDIPQEFDAEQLLSFINRTAALSPTVFWQRTRQDLHKVQLAQACLNQVMLAEANLDQANLSRAELIGINLAGANLQNADLSLANLAGANLSNANLTGASLEGADLSGANLKGTNLTSANLTNTCLFETLLDEQSKSFATRSGAIFSLDEFHTYTLSLAPTSLVDNAEDDELEGEPTIFIESAEGEFMLPDQPYGSDRNYYDGDTAQIEDPSQEIPIISDAQYDFDETDETSSVSDFEVSDI